MKEWTIKDIFLLVVSIVFLLLFWGSAISILGLSASYSDLLKIVNNIKFDNEDKEAIRGAVFFAKILLYSIPVLSIISIILVVTKQREAAQILLIVVANIAVVVIFVMEIDKDESAGKIFKDGLETIKKAGGFSLYSYMILEALLVILYPFLPGTPITNNVVSGTSSSGLSTRRCKKCRNFLDGNAKFCSICGEVNDDGCKKCGIINAPDAKFCKNCGLVLREDVPPPPPLENNVIKTSTKITILSDGKEYICDLTKQGKEKCAAPQCRLTDELANLYYSPNDGKYYHRNCIPE